MTDRSEHNDHNLDLPDRLADDLARLQHIPAVPPAVDMAILGSARLRMRRHRRTRRVFRWTAGVAAAVAVLAIAFHHLPLTRQPAAMRSSIVQVEPTILDAFQLARQLQRGPVADRRWDINGDGIIDRRDVDALASAAVSLKAGRAS